MASFNEIFRNMAIGDMMAFNPFDGCGAVCASRDIGRRTGKQFESRRNDDGTTTITRKR